MKDATYKASSMKKCGPFLPSIVIPSACVKSAADQHTSELTQTLRFVHLSLGNLDFSLDTYHSFSYKQQKSNIHQQPDVAAP